MFYLELLQIWPTGRESEAFRDGEEECSAEGTACAKALRTEFA